MIKRIFTAALIFMASVFPVIAQDAAVPETKSLEQTEGHAESNAKPEVYKYDESTSMFFYFNNASREDFEVTVKIGAAQEKTIFQMVSFIGDFTIFNQIEIENMDENERKMYDFALRNIKRRFNENDIIAGVIVNDMNLLEGYFDGWAILSHMLNKNDVESVIYYFTAEF